MPICSKCHSDLPISGFYFVRTEQRWMRQCKKCLIAASTKWCSEHRERAREHCRNWGKRNYVPAPPRIKKVKWKHYNRKRFQGPPKPSFVWLLKKHKILFLLLCAAEYERRQKKQKENRARWKKENPEYFRHKNKVKRARRKGSIGRFTKLDIDKIYTSQHGICLICHVKLKDYHIDHVMPIALGGSNWPDNLQLLCRECNIEKGAKHPVDFMQEKGYLL